ncbi:DMT family transporter [Flavobacterium adhaerens]|uniref:DMT family transporter n=1 Tax=Flavobacterium adhaerens TaxID=3149043 RepID=UPI0032B4C141
MIKNNTLKGIILVGLGATSFGMLATFVKIAYKEGYTTAEITISQFALGLIGLLIITRFQKSKNKNKITKATPKNISQLILAGTSIGLTSVFYYLSVKYIPVSIAIVLLMQTVWIGLILEMIIERKKPSSQKITAAIIVLIGTFLATNIFENKIQMNWRGFAMGILAACSFTTTMFTANKVAIQISSAQRSLYMLIGGAIIVFVFAIITQSTSFRYEIFLKWGILLSLFGTIIPPILMNSGFPLTGIGLGSIISALELPVSVFMSYTLLHEKVTFIQWTGIFLILLAIIIMNTNFKKKQHY